jgi:hypothetical protein
LDQFSHPLDRALDLDDRGGDPCVGRFAADRVRFAKHFLDDEIEFPSAGLTRDQGFAEHPQVTRQPGQFLTDVTSIGKNLDLAEQIEWPEIDAATL